MARREQKTVASGQERHGNKIGRQLLSATAADETSHKLIAKRERESLSAVGTRITYDGYLKLRGSLESLEAMTFVVQRLCIVRHNTTSRVQWSKSLPWRKISCMWQLLA